MWPQALDAYEKAISADRFRHVGRSNPHYREGVIYQWRLEPRQPDDALAAYEAALAIDQFSSPIDAAQTHYQYGYGLRERQTDVADTAGDYMAEFRRAVELNPKHVWAHIMLGIALHERDGGAAAAEDEFLTALGLEPDNTAALYHLGELYRQEGQTDRAVEMYERVLKIDPDFEAAKQALATLRGGE
jgi:tetratricopeptide (TPR) repeat protein